MRKDKDFLKRQVVVHSLFVPGVYPVVQSLLLHHLTKHDEYGVD